MNPPGMPMGTTDPEVIRNHKAMVISSAPKNLSFTMTPFYSNKKFSNVFGQEIRDIEQRVKFFIENKDWYDTKGIPYQLGIMLSGIPGAGKTSVIRAIANYTKRHIINVNFANITTATQLKNLFYSEKINIYTDTSMSNVQSYHIPIDQRLYVLEEIDAIGDIVKQRTSNTENMSLINDELTLGEILTVLDGTMEVPGRIVIMTSNHPEMLDKALVRPGRIDLQVNFGNADNKLIKEMFESYLDIPFPNEMFDELPDKQLSPAEVSQVLFRHFGSNSSVDMIIQDLRASVSRNTTSHMMHVHDKNKPKHTMLKDLKQQAHDTNFSFSNIIDMQVRTPEIQPSHDLSCIKRPISSNIEGTPMFKGLGGLSPEVKITQDGIIAFNQDMFSFSSLS